MTNTYSRDLIDCYKYAIKSLAAIPKIGSNFRKLEFDSNFLWLVVFLGELTSVEKLANICHNDARLNIVIVCLMEEEIEAKKLEILKKLVGNTREGILLVLRNRHHTHKSLGRQLDIELARVRAALKLYSGKQLPLIHEEIKY